LRGDNRCNMARDEFMEVASVYDGLPDSIGIHRFRVDHSNRALVRIYNMNEGDLR
jgi:hypothetical protein